MSTPSKHPFPYLLVSLPLLCSWVSGPAFAQQLPPPALQPNKTTKAPRKTTDKEAPVTIITPSTAPPTNGKSTGVFVLPPPAGGVEQPTETPDETDIQPPTQAPEDPVIIIEPDPTPKVTPKVTPRRAASVAGIKISGMNDVAALRKLGEELTPKLRAEVTLFDGQRKYTLRRDTLGAKIPLLKLLREAQRNRGDVPLRFEVDLVQAQRALNRLADDVNRRARPASLDYEDGSVVMSGGDGVKLAILGSAQRVQQALEAQPPHSQVDLVVARIPAGKGSTSEATLREMRYLLASFSTPYDAGIRGRTQNLRIAARNVNGTIVPAGGTFSANRAIGKRDAASGWREAQMFVSGQVVTGVGAGICQCASTLYNAVLLAGLPIVERHQHQFQVSYAPPSRDATLYWGSKDFRFRNNTGGPIYIQTFLSGGRFHARLFGVQPVRQKIKVEARTLSRKGGTRSVAYRVVESDTGTQREFLSRDFYMPHP